MRTLSSTLLNAQQDASHQPYLKVEVGDGLAGVARPRFSRLFSGAEPDFFHAAIIAPDGSLIRARVSPPPATPNLYVQRVPNPGPGSDFSPWTLLNEVTSASNVALYASTTTVYLIYVDPDGRSVYQRTSTNNGATWSAGTKILTPAEAGTPWIAGDINPSGKQVVFYATNTQILYRIANTFGAWGTPNPWPHSVTDIDGLACAYQGDWNLLLCGQATSGHYAVWTLVYGDGGTQPADTWSSLKELDRAQQDSSIRFHHGSLCFADVCRASLVEEFTGTPASSRPVFTHPTPTAAFADNLWTDSTPFDLASTYGVAVTYDGSALWLSTPNGVWRAPLDLTTLNLSADVLAATLSEEPLATQLTLHLRNDDGRYNSPGAGSLAQLQQGAQLRISPGYRTSAGIETSPGPLLWLTGWEQHVGQGQAELVIHTEGPWEHLRQWRARRQFSWDGGTASVAQIATALLAHAGLTLDTSDASAIATTFSPAFTVHPGERGDVAIRRLLDLLPDLLRFQDTTALLIDTSPTDPTDYAYGTGHSIPTAAYAVSPPSANRIQVFGKSGVGEGFLWQDLVLRQSELAQLHDLNLTTSQHLQDRTTTELRHRTVETAAGRVIVPANCGQELYDVVAITDLRAGLSAQPYRVLALTLHYATGRQPAYLHHLTLGGV